jgi:glycosyltransferase involved in cell wall biosynthesis
MMASPSISCLLMVKDEKERIELTLESTKNWISTYIVFDTGSTDGTQNTIKDWCDRNHKELHMKEGKFADFSTSRNVLLDYADTFPEEYQLMMDSSDELKTGQELHNFIRQYNGPFTGFLIKQVWFCGNSTQSYFNVRLIKARHNWRYRGAVHEYIYSPEVEKLKPLRVPSIILYQDRVSDNNKSFPRFSRDRAILWHEYKKNSNDARTTFYFAQTLGCLGQLDLSYKYYKQRSRMGGFDEEVFHSLLRCGDISRLLGHYDEEAIGWYMNAFNFIQRVEPLLYLSDMFRNKGKWSSAYMFCKMAMTLDFPEESILFVDRDAYDYKRYHMFSIIAFNYANTKKKQEQKTAIMVEAVDACDKAIAMYHKEIDINNKKYFTGEKKGEPTVALDIGLMSCGTSTGCQIPVGAFSS